MNQLNVDPRSDCPPEAVLLAFQRGDLAVPDVECVASHLSRCVRCLCKFDESGVSQIPSMRSDFLEAPLFEFRSDPHYLRMEKQAKQALANLDVAGGTPLPAGLVGLTPPVELGPYRIAGMVGRGGMGTVYRAWHVHLKQQKAIKFLNPHLAAPIAIARFRREMEVIGSLDHPNIARATDAGEWNGMHYLVMDFVQGKTLSALSQTGPMNVVDACELIRQAATGLQYVFQNNLVHRDIKPSNILLSETGVVKILDLGLATLARQSSSSEITSSHDVLGTADYMAPEQWRESRRVDIRADIYSLGCTFYRLLSGKAPFDQPELKANDEKRAAHLSRPVPPITSVRADVPLAVASVLERMLRKSPEERYSQPKEVADALTPHCLDTDLPTLLQKTQSYQCPVDLVDTNVAVRENTYAPALAARARRAWQWAILAALAIAIAAGAFGVFIGIRPADVDAPLVPATQREFALHKWHNLLDRPPSPSHVTNVSGQSHWELNAKTGALSITAFGKQLLSLGRTQGHGYRLNIAFEQPQPSALYGIFFGGQRSEEAGLETLRYQMIYVDWSGKNQRDTFILQRGMETIRYGIHPDGPLFYRGDLTAMPITRSLKSERQGSHVPVRMDIVVSKQPGLSSVTFNGDQYPDLLGVNQHFAFANYEGEFGIYCENCTVTVSSAQFLLTQ